MLSQFLVVSKKSQLIKIAGVLSLSLIVVGCSNASSTKPADSAQSAVKNSGVTVGSFGPFAKELTTKILSYDVESYDKYIENVKPGLSPKAFEKLKTGKLIPSSEEEMKQYASRMKLVSVKESKPISHDAKTSMIVATVDFVIEMQADGKPAKMQSTMVYEMGIKQKTGLPMVVRVGQSEYKKVEDS